MIKIHRDNRVIFWLLIGGLVLNILWSLRLELQAKTKNNVDIYHYNLNQNSDTLFGLEDFMRRADEISIKTNDQTSEIYMRSKGRLGINAGDNSIEMMSDKGLIDIRHHDSILKIGKAPEGEGISMGQKDWGSMVIHKGKGVGIVSAKKIILEARGEHAELTIVADGDINIRSKNGVVKINGKKIYMNKEDSQSSETSDISSPENSLRQSYEKDRNSFNATKIMQTSLKSRGFYDGAVDGSYGPNTKKALQEFLRKEGFYQGRVDGRSGEALRGAIKQYQKSNGLKITGHINPETANAMQR